MVQNRLEKTVRPMILPAGDSWKSQSPTSAAQQVSKPHLDLLCQAASESPTSEPCTQGLSLLQEVLELRLFQPLCEKFRVYNMVCGQFSSNEWIHIPAACSRDYCHRDVTKCNLQPCTCIFFPPNRMTSFKMEMLHGLYCSPDYVLEVRKAITWHGLKSC